MTFAAPAPPAPTTTADRRPRTAVITVFFVHGFLFASWTAHIPQLKAHLGLSDGQLGLALLGAPVGSVLAMVLATQLLPRYGSRAMVRFALAGYCVAGPFIGLTASLPTFLLTFLIWGFFQGTLDVSMNTQAITVERHAGRVLMPGFHGSWSSGALVGALTGAVAVGLGISLSPQLLVLATGCLLVAGWHTTALLSDPAAPTGQNHSAGDRRTGLLQSAVVILGAIAFADMLCEGAAADWAAVYLRTSLHAAALIAGLAYTGYALAMAAVRISGNRLFTHYRAQHLLPLLTVVATIGFTGGLLIDRPISALIGFAILGAGLASVIPIVFGTAGAIPNVDTGRAVATVAGCGWAGFVAGPVLIGTIASATTLHTALFVIPVLTSGVAVATAVTGALRPAAADIDASAHTTHRTANTG